MPKTRNSISRRPIESVIFDVDGTLVSNMNLIVNSFNYAVDSFVGRRYSLIEVYSMFGPTLEQMIEEVVPPENAKDAVQRYQTHYRRYFRQYARPYSGIRTLISGLRKAGINVGIFTGSDATMTRTTLEKTGLRNMFSVVVTADDVAEPKPDPEGLVRAIAMMTTAVNRTVYFGDEVHDIEASKRAGALSAAALWGFGDAKQLKSQQPDFAFDDPRGALRQLT
jgi:HAD superfamily hydrolase (TIGR01509 family)